MEKRTRSVHVTVSRAYPSGKGSVNNYDRCTICETIKSQRDKPSYSTTIPKNSTSPHLSCLSGCSVGCTLSASEPRDSYTCTWTCWLQRVVRINNQASKNPFTGSPQLNHNPAHLPSLKVLTYKRHRNFNICPNEALDCRSSGKQPGSEQPFKG